MTKKSFFKDLKRSIFKTKARFLSIMAIIALGVGFFAGINATEPDMILSADKYYKDYNLSDFRIVSPLGFKASDIQNVVDTEGVEKVQTGYAKDFFLSSGDGNFYTIKAFSYDQKDYLELDGLNIPVVKEGRMPEKSGEIAIEYGGNVPDYIQVGSKVTITLPEGEQLDDYLKTGVFTVVGRISSPLYIDFERGQTNIGDGSIGFFAYIAESDFSMEKVTDLFVRTSESPNLVAYSKAYADHLAPVEAALKSLGQEAIAYDTQLLRDDLNEGKAELQENKDKAEAELADGAKKLEDAAKAIADGEKELTDKEEKYTRELAEQRLKLKNGRIELENGQKLYADNHALWSKGNDAYQTGMDQLDASKAQLDQAQKQIAQAEAELAASKRQLDEASAQLEQLQVSIAGLTHIRQSLPLTLLTMTESKFLQLVMDIRVYSGELADSIQQTMKYDDLDLFIKLPLAMDTALAQMEKSYVEGKASYDAGMAQYSAGLSAVANSKNDYAAGLAEYQAGLAQLSASKAQLDQSKAKLDQAKAVLDQNEAQIIAGEAAVAQGEQDLVRELAEGRQKLTDAKISLAEGRITYEAEKADALQKIADAEIKIHDAERAILEIPDEWFVNNREANPGYFGYGDDAKRIGAVAKVFPLFFFLVAALVCLTTMTRMVEEERSQIGTLKALGYSTLTISSKYLVYALLASLSGALAGLLVGFRLFPGIIMNAYGMMYQIPDRLMPDHLNYAAISILIAVVTTVAASLLATLQELNATPAVLMQPKAPKPGKRIFLERIKPVWKRLSFTKKVTARNIFRYKRRLLMTVIGIAGCTALLLTGFGIRDSVNAIMGKQFSEIFIYDGLLSIDTDQSETGLDLAGIMDSHPEVTSYLKTQNETVSALPAGSGRTYEASLLVPESTQQLPQFFDLHERPTGLKLTLPTDGAVITEKLADLLAVQIGDTVSWRDSENRTYAVKVSGIAENYLTHYIYLSPEYFAKITYRTPQYNTVVFNVDNAAALDQKAFKENLLSHDGILGAILTLNLTDDFNDTIKSLNYVVMVLILSAGALAFVVLYNLTNINITERIREIATIKVLGFRDKEVSAYVYRENIILTVIGTFAGLFLGFFMHRFVMGTMEIDSMMFGKNINTPSYLLSIVLTLSFAILVNIFMHYHLRKINMVESLKSIE